jgi:hypothetical protein
MVSDFDVDRRFGVIGADKGRLQLFNLQDSLEQLRDPFKVGMRAEFTEREADSIVRAVTLFQIKPMIRE